MKPDGASKRRPVVEGNLLVGNIIDFPKLCEGEIKRRSELRQKEAYLAEDGL